MDEEIEHLVIRVRADTQGFDRDVKTMRDALDGPFSEGVERAGRQLETSLLRAVRTGKLGFDDLKRGALAALAEIAVAAVRAGLQGQGASSGSAKNGLVSLGTAALAAFLGAPGRATGGPVSPGQSYTVGERGPELFVPTSSGTIVPMGQVTPRDVRVSIQINSPAATAPDVLARSSRQVARAVRNALAEER